MRRAAASPLNWPPPDPEATPLERLAINLAIAKAKAGPRAKASAPAEPPPSGSRAIVYVTPRRRRFAP